MCPALQVEKVKREEKLKHKMERGLNRIREMDAEISRKQEVPPYHTPPLAPQYLLGAPLYV